MTGMPAEVYSLPNIGLLKKGMNADITVFDYAKVDTLGDYDYPFRGNTGIDCVIVNGGIAVRDGHYTGLKNGRIVKKAK